MYYVEISGAKSKQNLNQMHLFGLSYILFLFKLSYLGSYLGFSVIRSSPGFWVLGMPH